MVRRKLLHLKPEDILASHTQEVVFVMNKLRRIVKAAIPEAVEVAYPVWHAIGYRHQEAGYFCGLFPYKDHVKVYFEHGRFLLDDNKILVGNGRQTKYIFVRTLKDIKITAFKKLLKTSVDFKKKLPRAIEKKGS